MRKDLGPHVIHHLLTDQLHEIRLAKLAHKSQRKDSEIQERDEIQPLQTGHFDVVVNDHLGEVGTGQAKNGNSEQKENGDRHQQTVGFEVKQDALEQSPVLITITHTFMGHGLHFRVISICWAKD
jgi:hypothetical protein